jgi:hypothetical protein
MTDVSFDRLRDVALRDAWKHEANDFTPWLAQNIDHIADAVGIPLEITGTEILVGTFFADILARNPQDDGLVLIENQLEATDHAHLGQIMTYLAGLEAKTVIWIAPTFREPHLSAIRWLNEHTVDGFAFFALKLRVVRIGESPYAPIFEVVEKPNDWDREIKQKAVSEGASYYDVKQRFWHALLERQPELRALGFRDWRYPNNYVTLRDDPQVNVSVWVGKAKSGIFVRSAWGEPAEPVAALLEPYRAALEERLKTHLGPSGRGAAFLARGYSKGHADEADWPEIMDWMTNAIAEYRAALTPILTEEALDA